MNDPVTRGWQIQLDREDLAGPDTPADPIALFADWFETACGADLVDATAMTLATADAEGRPSARTVLLKGFDAAGFCFYSNRESRKGRELAVNPNAALVFWWDRLERQVRIEGTVSALSAATSDEYFASRSRGSQIGAHASPQSRVIGSREALQAATQQATQQFADTEVPRPAHWGGYALAPRSIEFWQGRANRLHDRLRYQREHSGWQCERLAP